MNELSAPALAGLPFPLHLPPEQAVAHPGWVQARTALLDAMRQGQIAVLIGPPGVGKTLLLREVARQLRAEGQAPGFAERGDTAPTDAALPLVDEAEALPDEALQALLARGGPAVLAALPGFLRRLDALATPAVIVPLTPMTAAETRRFVAAIAPPGLFGEDAVAALAVLSQGLPRLAATLGRAAAFQARLEGAGPVTARHVTEAEAMRAGAFPADEPAVEDAQAVRPRRVVVSPAPAAEALPASAPLPDAAAPDPAPPDATVEDPAPSAAPADARPADVTEAQPAVALAEPVGPPLGGVAPVRAAPPRRRRAWPAALLAAAAAVAAGLWFWPNRLTPEPPAPVAPAATEAAPATAPAVAEGPPAGEALPEPPPPPPAATVAAPLQFRGANYNETLGRSGSLLLVITRRRGDAVTVRFESSGGLIGAGELEGRLTEDGRLTASGTLLMGRNPFVTDLEALVLGDVMNGTAHYARLVEPGLRTSATRSQFRLTRF